MKKSLITKFLLGSLIVPSLIMTDLSASAGGVSKKSESNTNTAASSDKKPKKPENNKDIKLARYLLLNVFQNLNTESASNFIQINQNVREVAKMNHLLDLSQSTEFDIQFFREDLYKNVETLRLRLDQILLKNSTVINKQLLTDLSNEGIKCIRLNCVHYSKDLLRNLLESKGDLKIRCEQLIINEGYDEDLLNAVFDNGFTIIDKRYAHGPYKI